MNPNEAIQGTPEWKGARLGQLSASRLHLGLARSRDRKTWGASRYNLMASLIAERLTGVPMETFQSDEMVYGTDTEAEAADAYAFAQSAELATVGYVPHPTILHSGASPDRLVGNDGLAEFKCPNTATHIDTLLSGDVDRKYVWQMQWQLACTGRKWCDFVSYDNRLPGQMRLFVRRFPRDEALIAELSKGVTEFLAELAEKLAALRSKFA